MRSRLSLALAFALTLAASGCQAFTATYWDDVKDSYAAEAREPTVNEPHVHFLGVRASETVAPFQIGVKLLHVFGASPAFRAGLEAGDELRTFDGKAVRTASELRAALTDTEGGDVETVPIVYARDGQQYQTSVDLVTWAAYVRARRQRIFAEAAYNESEFPFFFKQAERELTPDFVEHYFGVRPEENVRVYYDLTLFPLVTGVAVFRREWSELVGGTRTQIWHWPFRITTTGEDRSGDLHGLIPPPPPDTADL